MRLKSYLALICFICLCICIIPAAQARTWYVPGDCPDLPAALQVAQSGDEILIAIGNYKIVGREHQVPSGITIKGGAGIPGSCVMEESGVCQGEWRDAPIFIVNEPGRPTRFEGITFRNFNLGCGEVPYVCNPIFYVTNGRIQFEDCQWQDFYKKVFHFDGGSGSFVDCEFSEGLGCPSAITFAGDELIIDNCVFKQNEWIMECDELHGSILALEGGTTRINNSLFCDNGPLIEMLMVGPNAILRADNMCMTECATMWEAVVEGHAYLSGCLINPVLWQTIGDGEIHFADGPGDKAMAVELKSLSQVKSMFQ